MGTCENCKHWKEIEEAYAHNKTLTVCDRVGYFEKGTTMFDLYAEALDDSGLEVELVTGPDFGCVHFEEG